MTNKENIYNNLGQINISDTNCEECLHGEEVSRPATEEELHFMNVQGKLHEEEKVEDEPEEKSIDEMTYEQALDIILSQVDLVESEENIMCKDVLEEAIKRLRKYENNKIVDDLAKKELENDKETKI